MIPLVNDVRDIQGWTPEDSFVFIQMDGEDIQIKCYFEDVVRQILKSNNIEIGKSAASSTEITQACDSGNIFKGTKTKMLNITFMDIDHTSQVYLTLRNLWKQVMDDHKMRMTPAHIKSGIEGVIKAHKAFREVATPEAVLKSFKIVGIQPYSIDQMNSQCTAPLSAKEMILLRRNMDYLHDVFAEKGEYMDSELAAIGIAKNINRGKPKDELVICRRRCMNLTNDNVPERETARLGAIAASVAARAARIAENKRMAQLKRDNAAISK
jgi:hypothetical protein